MLLLDPFMRYHQWERWGQWIGVHICRSNECVREAAAAGQAVPQISDFAALARQLAAMPLDGESVPRFYVASDLAGEDLALQAEIWALNLTGAKGTALVYPKEHRQLSNSLEGLREEVADFYLLSRTALIVATPHSALARAVAAAGHSFLVEVEAQGKGGVGEVAQKPRHNLHGHAAGQAGG